MTSASGNLYFILTANLWSHRCKLRDESETALPKDMQQGLVMQTAPPGEVGGAKRASRQNARFHTATQRIIIDPTKTLGIRRMQACLRHTLTIYAVRIVSFVLFKMARGFAENDCEIIWSYFGLGK